MAKSHLRHRIDGVTERGGRTGQGREHVCSNRQGADMAIQLFLSGTPGARARVKLNTMFNSYP